jgi:hypothetical protein
MELEKQVCSLELAKRLHELRLIQDASYYWCLAVDRPGESFLRDRRCYERQYAAFTVAELGELLPTPINSIRFQDYWRCAYQAGPRQEFHYVEAASEADARAKMLIYLQQNKLIPASVAPSSDIGQ